MKIDPKVIEWLMEGDPVIRWQVMRDLQEKPEKVWRAEQARIPTEGWGKEFLRRQQPNGEWPAGRWTEKTLTLLMLLDCGMPYDAPLSKAANLPISNLFPR